MCGARATSAKTARQRGSPGRRDGRDANERETTPGRSSSSSTTTSRVSIIMPPSKYRSGGSGRRDGRGLRVRPAHRRINTAIRKSAICTVARPSDEESSTPQPSYFFFSPVFTTVVSSFLSLYSFLLFFFFLNSRLPLYTTLATQRITIYSVTPVAAAATAAELNCRQTFITIFPYPAHGLHRQSRLSPP